MGSPAGRHRCRFEATFCDPPLSLPSDCSVLPGERCVLWWCSMLKGTPECGVAQDMSSLALKFSQGAALLRLRCASQFIEKWKEFSSLGKTAPKSVIYLLFVQPIFNFPKDLSGPICSTQCAVLCMSEYQPGCLRAPWCLGLGGCFGLCTGSGSDLLWLGKRGWLNRQSVLREFS